MIKAVLKACFLIFGDSVILTVMQIAASDHKPHFKLNLMTAQMQPRHSKNATFPDR